MSPIILQNRLATASLSSVHVLIGFAPLLEEAQAGGGLNDNSTLLFYGTTKRRINGTCFWEFKKYFSDQIQASISQSQFIMQNLGYLCNAAAGSRKQHGPSTARKKIRVATRS
jgi:hypothetical protein